MGEDRVSKKGRAKLGDGLVAPEVMGKGAIDPWQPYLVAPVGSCEQPADGVHSGECNGVDTPKDMGEGAINPCKQLCSRIWGLPPPMLAKGTRWQEECAAGAADGIMLPCWW